MHYCKDIEHVKVSKSFGPDDGKYKLRSSRGRALFNEKRWKSLSEVGRGAIGVGLEEFLNPGLTIDGSSLNPRQV